MAGAAGVAHGGEAPPQHAAQQQRRAQRHQHVRHVHLLRQIELDGDRMHMQVDQAGHQRLALQIDGAVGFHLERPIGDLLDQTVLDQYVMSLQEVRLKRIEQSGVLEEHTGHDDFLSYQDWMSSAGKASWANGRHAATSSSPYQPASWSRLSEPSVRPRQRTGMLSTLSQPSEAISS